MNHDTFNLDGYSAEVKLASTQVLEGKKTRASQYDPVTMPSLPEIPGNILIQFLDLILLVFGTTNNFLCSFYFCFILELSSFAKEMIRNAFDQAWSGTLGPDDLLQPIILPLYYFPVLFS